MRLTIANITKSISSSDFLAAIRAIRRQVNDDFGPEWSVTATLRATALNLTSKAPVDGSHDAILYVGDASQDPTTGVEGALGYHSENHRNIPYGFVYLDICAEYGDTWTSCLSHEVLRAARGSDGGDDGDRPGPKRPQGPRRLRPRGARSDAG